MRLDGLPPRRVGSCHESIYDATHGIAQITQQVPTVCDLDGLGSAFACPFDVIVRPIPSNDLDLGMRP